MARPRKDNAEWFRHDSDARNDDKLLYLRAKFGLPGYALFFMILEKMASTDGFGLQIDDINLTLMAQNFGTTPELLTGFIQVASDHNLPPNVRVFDLINGKLISVGLNKRLSELIDKRQKGRGEEVSGVKTIVSDAETPVSEENIPQTRDRDRLETDLETDISTCSLDPRAREDTGPGPLKNNSKTSSANNDDEVWRREWIEAIHREEKAKWGKVWMTDQEIDQLSTAFGDAYSAVVVAVRTIPREARNIFRCIQGLIRKHPEVIEEFRQKAEQVSLPPKLRAMVAKQAQQVQELTAGIGRPIPKRP